MRASLLFAVAVLVSCTSTARDERGDEEHVASQDQAFTSAHAVLADFELEARIITPTNDPPTVRSLLETQLLYTIGQLNGDRSVARLDRAELTGKTLGNVPGDPPEYELTYQVKLPVAWGGGPLPSSYAFALPLRVGEDDQAKFTAKYAKKCSDPEGGIRDSVKDSGRMFLFYRPNRPGCELSPSDVFRSTATVTLSKENTQGRYPEYHLVWADHALDFVAVFGRELEEGEKDDDAGAKAYASFVAGADAHLSELQPKAEKRTRSSDAAILLENVRLAAELDDGREVHVDAILGPPHPSKQNASFDAWYDAHTREADVIFYSGHAGLGDNVRALAKKGDFAAGKYVVNVINGCDTFAYLDPTLVKRRALVNPDDPTGTKYMDAVTNVLGGFFHTGDETAQRFLRAMTTAPYATPQTYREIAEGVDATQVMVVSGEEDNVFAPGMIPAPPNSEASPPPIETKEPPAEEPVAVGNDDGDDDAPRPRSKSGCSASSGDRESTEAGPFALAALVALFARRALTRSRRAAH